MTMTEPSVIVRVVWHDAHSVGSGWQTLDDIGGEPCVVESVGILISKVKADHVVMAQVDAGTVYRFSRCGFPFPIWLIGVADCSHSRGAESATLLSSLTCTL